MSNQEELLNYYNYKEREFNCKYCGWLGLGEKLEQGEMFRECFEVCCPNCHECIKAIVYPTIQESHDNWSEVEPVDKLTINAYERKRQEYLDKKLKSADQLPDVDCGAFIVEWDQLEDEIVLRCGNDILFKEPAFFECYERFMSI